MDVAADGRIVAGIATTEASLGGAAAATSLMVTMYDPSIDSYKWSRIITDAVDLVDVHFAFDDQRVLINWIEWASGSTRRARRARQLKSDGEYHFDYEEKKRERRRQDKVSKDIQFHQQVKRQANMIKAVV